MATISNQDKVNLNAEQQKQIAALKDQWAAANAAGDQAGMDASHKQAEQIRANAGYSGGAAGNAYAVNSVNNGGMNADQMRAWLENYQKTNYDPEKGWINGYDVSMNSRSKANKIRQQMQANSDAWHTADAEQRKYLHDQNLALAQLLYDYTGQSKKNTWYDEKTGKWYTHNRNVGYGEEVYPEGYAADAKQYYGYTDEQLKNWATDPSIYSNFVDTRASSRNNRNEASGFSGEYAQFVNGPYLQLMLNGSHQTPVDVYTNVLGDGFYDQADLQSMVGGYSGGNLDRLKNNNAMDEYTGNLASYTQNGVIMPGSMMGGNSSGVTRDYSNNDPVSYYENYGKNSQLGSYGGGRGSANASGGTYEDYIKQMYDAALQAQLNNLKASYDQNISELDASVGKVDDTYTEQKRQTTGTNAQQAANWRELANAYGLNSGAIGQAALAQNNQLQSNLNTLESAQAAAQAEIERQRTLLGQQYQLQINQAIAENNMSKAEMLYQEAVRADEALRQQQQFNANLMLQYAQMGMQQKQWEDELALSYAKAAQSGGSGSLTAATPVTGPTPFDTNALYEAMYQGGARNYDDALYFLTNKYNQVEYGFGSNEEFIGSAADRFVDWANDRARSMNATNFQSNGISPAEFNTLIETVQRLKNSNQGGMLDSLLANYADVLTDQQFAELMMLSNYMR